MTRSPRDSSSLPMDAETMPFPRLETTPPVIKIYLGILFLFQNSLGSRQIRRLIDANGFIWGFNNFDANAALQRPQLLEPLVCLQKRRWLFFKHEEKIFGVSVQADVFIKKAAFDAGLKKRRDGCS